MAEVDVKLKIDGLDTLDRDFKNFAVAMSRESAQYAKAGMQQTYRDILDRFYSEYTPKVYERTYQLLHSSYHAYYHSPHGVISHAGIELTPTRMKYENNFEPSQVIEDFLDGMHGGRISVDGAEAPYDALCRLTDLMIDGMCEGKTRDDLIAKAAKTANLSILKVK